MLRTILLTAVSLIAAWSLLYIGIWLVDSGCGSRFTEACLNAPARPLADFFSLGWVTEYETLTGGLLTFLGASAAVIAVLMQINHNLEVKQADRRLKHLGILARMKMKWRTVYQDFAFGDWPETVQTFEEIDDLCAEVVQVSPHLAQWIQIAVVIPLNYSRRQAKGMNSPTENLEKSYQAIAAAQTFLSEIDEMVDERGGYIHRRQRNTDAIDLYKNIHVKGAPVHDLPELYDGYFY